MPTPADVLTELLRVVQESELLAAADIRDAVVVGRTRLNPARADVDFDLDPELDEADDEDDVDLDLIVEGLRSILSISIERWRSIVDAIAVEIEEAVGEDVEIQETTDLRDDLTIDSVTVMSDATLLSFAAPRQFPDSWIQVQLDDDLEIEDVVVEEKDLDDDGRPSGE